MILQSLYQLASQEYLVDDPDFETKPVSWMVQLDRDGSLLQVVSLRRNLNQGTQRKPKYQGTPMLLPRQALRTRAESAFFLVDKSEYAFGFDPTQNRAPAQLRSRLSLFRSQVQACARATNDLDVLAVLAFLHNVETDASPIQAAFQRDHWASGELFAFSVGTTGQPVHLRPAVCNYWKRLREQVPPGAGRSMFQCLVTGAAIGAPERFPKIKGVPGGGTPETSLVSFNGTAFESYGLQGNENAPVSRLAAERIATALNRLLHDAYPNPRAPGATLPRHQVRLSPQTTACFWSGSLEPEAENFADNLPDLLEAEREANVAGVYRSLWQGRAPAVTSMSKFYVLVLSGTQGRAIVRDWLETTPAATARNLGAHFADLRNVRSAPARRGSSEPPAMPLRSLLNALVPLGKREAISGSLAAGFLRAALTGEPYPFEVLQRALVRARVEAAAVDRASAVRSDARASLIRAVLNRHRRFDVRARQRYPEVPSEMQPQLASAGYVRGLGLAVLDRWQALVRGNSQASGSDRCFAAASMGPHAVWERLLQKSQRLGPTALAVNDANARWLFARLRQVIDELGPRLQGTVPAEPVDDPGMSRALDLEQQGLFMIGYQQMRYWLWMTREERQRWEQEHPAAPEAYHWTKTRRQQAAARRG